VGGGRGGREGGGVVGVGGLIRGGGEKGELSGGIGELARRPQAVPRKAMRETKVKWVRPSGAGEPYNTRKKRGGVKNRPVGRDNPKARKGLEP